MKCDAGGGTDTAGDSDEVGPAEGEPTAGRTIHLASRDGRSLEWLIEILLVGTMLSALG